MEFVTAELLLSAYNPLHAFLLALMVNARHLFYGLSMLQKYRGTGMKKFYLIFGMCDESFSSTAPSPRPPMWTKAGSCSLSPCSTTSTG